MTAVEFPEVNVRIAEHQPEYETLPARVGYVPMGNGQVVIASTFCFELSGEELLRIQETGVIWHTVLTFGNPLQPQQMSVEKPEFIEP